LGQTICEKILAKASGRDRVKPGDIVYPIPEAIICPESAFPGFIDELLEIGVKKLWHPERVIVSVDHDPMASTVAVGNRLKKLRNYVKELGIKNFYDLGNHGIGHILPIEKGHVRPGMFVHSMDTHAPSLGSVGAFAASVVYELPIILATGTTWMKVPPSLKINLTGTLQPGVMARDIGLWVISRIGDEKGDYRAFEFVGPLLQELDISGRMTLCTLTPEIGGKTGITNPDRMTLDYVRGITDQPFTPMVSDPDAEYEETFDFDVSGLIPQIATPPTPDTVVPITKKGGVKINQAVIGSCVSSMLSDLRAAARIFKGHKVAPHVRCYITPGTHEIYLKALKEGMIDIFAQAGALVTPAGCGLCPGGGPGRLGDGEVCISTTTRNDPGRMGSSKAEIYLASPMTVAASAIQGEITDPRKFL
jgi:3-isopropylmalate/(R)-2-methylmalate dehydratase large subunit